MIKEIISDGETGVARAALDAAIQWHIPHGGWISEGRGTEDGRLPNKYQLSELGADDTATVAEKNVVESDGTLLLSRGPMTPRLALYAALAQKHERPSLHADLLAVNAFEAARRIDRWVSGRGLEVLNVSGPKSSEDAYIYPVARKTLITFLHIDFIRRHMPDPQLASPLLPHTVEEAADLLKALLPLKERTLIARLEASDLKVLHASLGPYIRERCGLRFGNSRLLESCRSLSGVDDLDVDKAPKVIIEYLWTLLRETHSLRVVK
jgi:hypothetical protein